MLAALRCPSRTWCSYDNRMVTARHEQSERGFEALADPQQRVARWGVEGWFQVTRMESDLRPGGAWQIQGLKSAR
jgi:uncharacterized protein YndB with AHSA1/START domain